MRKSKQTSHCPMDALLELLSGPWTTLILWVLEREGERRFLALKRAVPGISARILTVRLRQLESAGIVYRVQQLSIPPEVRYGLTARGKSLGAILAQMNVLAQEWAAADQAPALSAPSASP